MRNVLAIFLALTVALPPLALAQPLQPFSFTAPVTEDNGDTVTTNQVSVGVCAGASCPTLVSGAVTTNTNRRRCLANASAFAVWIGSSTTTLSTTGFRISESTGTYPTWCTYSTAALYGTGLSTATVTLFQETNSKP